MSLVVRSHQQMSEGFHLTRREIVRSKGFGLPFGETLSRHVPVRAERIEVDGVVYRKVVLNNKRSCFLSNVTTVLPASEGRGFHTEAFSGLPELPFGHLKLLKPQYG